MQCIEWRQTHKLAASAIEEKRCTEYQRSVTPPPHQVTSSVANSIAMADLEQALLPISGSAHADSGRSMSTLTNSQ